MASPQRQVLAASEFYRLSVDQYHAMGDAGILDEDDHVELLEGLLVCKDLGSTPHPVATVDLGELFPLSVERYQDMGRAGVLSANDRVELLEGVIFNRMAILPPHTGTVIRLNAALKPTLPTGWRYRQEQPVILPDGEPIPDGAIAAGTDDDNFRFHPAAKDVVVVIEVSDTTLLRDRGIKLRSYARAGIPIYWIVNLVDRQVEVYTDPDPAALPEPTYRQRDVYAGDSTLALAIAPDAELRFAVASLLPPP